MTPDALQLALGVACGGVVGFVLGLVGGGGSILAVPLLVYVVGIRDPHLAIGTSALAVAANAACGLATHARAGTVRWRPAGIFAGAGMLGAWLGSTLGKAVDGDRLLGLFSLIMVLVGVLMLRAGNRPNCTGGCASGVEVQRIVAFGAAAGAMSGFFGIGGGFLIVPGLLAATGMPMLNAVGSSLVAVATFGAVTAVNYASSGLVLWTLAAALVLGGAAGGFAGVATARRASHDGRGLRRTFAALVFLVAAYVLLRSLA